jgi:alkylation response protein AidB-like acyl-CoA dehydrogenase
VRKGDRYVVSGQKTWTTLASTPTGCSAWCAPITEAKKQEGISFLLIDMKSRA